VAQLRSLKRAPEGALRDRQIGEYIQQGSAGGSFAGEEASQRIWVHQGIERHDQYSALFDSWR